MPITKVRMSRFYFVSVCLWQVFLFFVEYVKKSLVNVIDTSFVHYVFYFHHHHYIKKSLSRSLLKSIDFHCQLLTSALMSFCLVKCYSVSLAGYSSVICVLFFVPEVHSLFVSYLRLNILL